MYSETVGSGSIRGETTFSSAHRSRAALFSYNPISLHIILQSLDGRHCFVLCNDPFAINGGTFLYLVTAMMDVYRGGVGQLRVGRGGDLPILFPCIDSQRGVFDADSSHPSHPLCFPSIAFLVILGHRTKSGFIQRHMGAAICFLKSRQTFVFVSQGPIRVTTPFWPCTDHSTVLLVSSILTTA